MGVIVKPKNLNDRQMKRVDRIEESNPLRARTVASRISERRNARGAENPQIAKAIAERRSMAQPMKKAGKIIKKAQNGKKTSFGMLSVKAGVDNNPSATFADKIAGAKKKAKFGKKMQYGGEAASMVPTMKKGGMKKKYKHGGTVSMQLGSYDRQIGKNYTGKATKAVGLTKAKYGKTIMKGGGKCKNGC
jgi:hypothetical protein